MQVEAIPMLINSDFMEIPLDKRQDLMDYKLYGEESHVFQNKDRLHSLYETTGLTMNDLMINGEVLEYFIANNKHIGKALSNAYGVDRKETLLTLSTITAVLNSSTAMTAIANSPSAITAVLNSPSAITAVLNSPTALQVVVNSSTAMQAIADSPTALQVVLNSPTVLQVVVNSPTAMQAIADSPTALQVVLNSPTALQVVVNSPTAMQAIADSSTAMTTVSNSATAISSICKARYDTTKAFIKAVNNNADYIKKIIKVVTTNNVKFQYVISQYGNDVWRLNQHCNTPNTIVLCALGYERNYPSASVNLFINNEKIKTSNSAGDDPQQVNKYTCNAIAVPVATFTENSNGYAAILVYKAI